jgi:phosphoribosyl 1,2-cyclic phosphodiesterase
VERFELLQEECQFCRISQIKNDVIWVCKLSNSKKSTQVGEILLKILPLFSGSSGNSTYIESGKTKVLIDIGCTAKRTETILKQNSIDPCEIDYIVLTHEHGDHVKGVKVFSKRYSPKIYASRGTIDALLQKDLLPAETKCEVISEVGMDLGDVSIRPFRTSHDCNEGFGYVITTNAGEKVGFATDLGYISDEVLSALNGVEVLFIESNHDVRMLENGPYPYFLKRRILSQKGHLSNETCASALPSFVKSGTRKFVLSHLSEHNNFPGLAFRTAVSRLLEHNMKKDRDFEICVAEQSNSGGVWV